MPIVKKQSMKKKAAKSSMASAWDYTDSISLLLYGRSGTGKTTLWATFPKPILAIICSGGIRPGELKSINTPEYRKTIKAWVVRESTDVRDLLETAGDFATVVLDHGSGLQDLVLKEVLGLDELPAQKSWGLASQQQYGQCTQQCKEIMRAMLNLPQHRVIVAQERSFEGDGNNQDVIAPCIGAAMTPSLVGWLNPACDYIGETFIRGKTIEKVIKSGKKTLRQRVRVKGVEYCLRTGPHDVFTTKFRVPRGRTLPEEIVDPSFEAVMEIINGKG